MGLSAIGTLPLWRGRTLGNHGIAVAEALASGFMLGLGFILTAELQALSWRIIVGASVGVLSVHLFQRYFADDDTHGAGYQLILHDSVHAGAEGLAIGSTMAVNMELGIFLAMSLALHNVAESMVTAQTLCARGLNLKIAAGLTVMIKTPQMLVAVSTYAIVQAQTEWLPWVLGAAAGSLFYVILTDVLPEAYARGHKIVVALLVSISGGLIVLFKGLFQ